MLTALATALKTQEDIIEDGLPSWSKMVYALANIREHSLWRGKFESFDDYCVQRWGFKKRRAQQLIAGGEVALELAHNCAPNVPQVRSEAVSRALGKAPKGERAAALAEAAESAPKGKVTAKHVKSVVAKRADASPAAPKDQLDRAIKQDYVAKAFARSGELSQLKNRVDALARELKAVDDMMGAHLNRQQIETDLRFVATNIRFGLPYAVCPYCKGEKCEHCHYVGWVPKKVWGNIPESVKK